MEPDVSEYLDLSWSQVVIYEVDDEGNQFYTATHPELLWCRGQGQTPEEAIVSLREARELYLQALVECDIAVPKPRVFCQEDDFRWV